MVTVPPVNCKGESEIQRYKPCEQNSGSTKTELDFASGFSLWTMHSNEEKGYRLTVGRESWEARFTWFTCMGHRKRRGVIYKTTLHLNNKPWKPPYL